MFSAYIYFKTLLYERSEQKQVEKTLWASLPFKEKDQALLAAYKGISPYNLCRDYLRDRGEGLVHAYGETPLTTLAHIAEEAGISEKDHVIELGAGRGRSALFFASYLGCTVTAYEMVPFFAKTLQAVAGSNLEVRRENYFKADLSEGTVVYLYGTLLKDHEIEDLIPRLPPGAKIFTVSFPLSDYSGDYETKLILKGSFPWGSTEVYWNERATKKVRPMHEGPAPTQREGSRDSL